MRHVIRDHAALTDARENNEATAIAERTGIGSYEGKTYIPLSVGMLRKPRVLGCLAIIRIRQKVCAVVITNGIEKARTWMLPCKSSGVKCVP